MSTTLTSIATIDQLRLDEGTPYHAAQRIRKLAKQRKITLAPGLYLSTANQGMACFVGLLSAEVYRHTHQLQLDNGELIAHLNEAAWKNADTVDVYDEELDDYVETEEHDPNTPDSDSGDDLREFIADHTLLDLEAIEQIEAGFENQHGFYVDTGGRDQTWHDGFPPADKFNTHGTLPPSRMRGEVRLAWDETSREFKIGYYLRLLAKGVLA